jgi:formylglycine-generating enzyme required for sulfatase activity
MREYPEHRFVVTSRSQDELWRKLRSAELIQDAVVVQTISDAQAQGYLQAHLGQEKGQGLHDRLDASFKSLARTPLLLKLIKDAGGGSDQLPRNRGELFEKYVMNKLLEREQKLELKETPEAKKKALAYLAFALQLNHQLACDRKWAEKVLAEKGLGAKTDTLLKEALLHGLLIQQTLPGKQLLRFIHQSVQEYFVALMLLSEVKFEKNANFLQVISRGLSKHNLTVWAKDTWWSESFVQLAGLVDDSDWLARKIAYVSPWLAWWCVQERCDVPDNTREMIEIRSIKLLHSKKVAKRKGAVQTLTQIKNDRILKPLLIAAGDVDKEVAEISVRVLAENNEAVHIFIEKLLRQNDPQAWRASFRLLGLQPYNELWTKIPQQAWEDIFNHSMVWVPASEFIMGSDENHDPKADKYEFPKHFLYLPGYWIGRFPVTVMQWHAFVKETGYAASAKSLQDPINNPVRYVNWEDAMTYCKWLSEKSGLPVSLPSEAEWEKAARGASTDLKYHRIFPWGNEFSVNKCNTYESKIGNTTPVGMYSPVGDSPFGCADMAGNVCEWTCSIQDKYPYISTDGRENLDNAIERIVRGGSWRNFQVLSRISNRVNYDTLYRLNYLGFRIVVRPPSF